MEVKNQVWRDAAIANSHNVCSLVRAIFVCLRLDMVMQVVGTPHLFAIFVDSWASE